MPADKMTEPLLKGPGGGELPHAGNRTRAPLAMTDYTIAVYMRADGSGWFVLHHGGTNGRYEFDDGQRRVLLDALGGTHDFARAQPAPKGAGAYPENETGGEYPTGMRPDAGGEYP